MKKAKRSVALEAMPEDVNRYQGNLYWIHEVDNGGTSAKITRAILRRDEIVMEFESLGDTYHVLLQRRSGRSYEGVWEAGGPRTKRTAPIQCRILDDGADLVIRGTWIEDGDYKWFGELEQVEIFTDER